jgi:hypothetical protein
MVCDDGRVTPKLNARSFSAETKREVFSEQSATYVGNLVEPAILLEAR